MIERIEARVTEMLRRYAGHTLSLRRLHELLVREFGAEAGSYHQLQLRLKQSRTAFRVREQAAPLASEITWPLELKEAYTRAMQRAGFDLSPLITLTGDADPSDDAPGIIASLERSLCTLQQQCSQDSALAADHLSTLSELPELQQAFARAQRTTTAPPGPRPAG